jgi:hypothetical protein
MMRRHVVWTWIVSTGVASLLIAGSLAWYFLSVAVTLYNSASATLENVRISIGSTEYWTGTLGVDEKHSIRHLPQGEGAVTISFDANGRTFRQQFGYVTLGLRGDFTIFVMPSFEMRAMPKS